MHVVLRLILEEVRLDRRIEIVDRDAVTRHHFHRDWIVSAFTSSAATTLAFRYCRGGRENQRRSSFFHPLDQGIQVGAIQFRWDGVLAVRLHDQVVQPPVEMNHVPPTCSQPRIHAGESVASVGGVVRNPVDVRLAPEHLAHIARVAD